MSRALVRTVPPQLAARGPTAVVAEPARPWRWPEHSQLIPIVVTINVVVPPAIIDVTATSTSTPAPLALAEPAAPRTYRRELDAYSAAPAAAAVRTITVA